MCVIIGCVNQKPNKEIVDKCHRANSDGAGAMWFEGDKVCYEKGLNNEQIFDLIQKIELPFVLHFRAASIGGKSEKLTHPFEMSVESPLKMKGSCDKAVVHNGTVSEWELLLAAAGIEKPIGEDISDSRAIAMISGKDNEKFLAKIKGNYIVADGSTGDFRTYGDFRDGIGQDEAGMIFSNFTWRYKNSTTSTSSHVTTHYGNHHRYGGHDSDGAAWESEGGTAAGTTTVAATKADKEKTEEVEMWWLTQLND